MAHTVLSPVDVVFDVIGREILKRSTELARPGRNSGGVLGAEGSETGVSCRSLAGDGNWQDAPSRLALGVFALILSGWPSYVQPRDIGMGCLRS